MGQRVSSCIHPRFTCSNSVYANYGDYEKLKSEPDDSYHLQKYPQDYEKLQSQETDSFYIQISHQEPHFPFELGKQLSGPLRLSNKSDNYVAFKVKTSNPLNCAVRPKCGVVLPRSICDITVTMRAQMEAPCDMQHKNKFLIQSIVARPGATREDITPEMFGKKSGNEVKECKFRVVYDTPPQPPLVIREGTDKDLKASNEQVEKQDTSFQAIETINKPYLQIHPQELQFSFELNKQISCSLQLSNKSDNYVAFKVKNTNPWNYVVRPIYGVVLPRSICDITVTMQAQKEVPHDMKCKDKFLIQTVVARAGATAEDVTSIMFDKDSGFEVEENKLRVVYVGRPQRKSLVQASVFPDEARALISKLTEERNSLIEQNKRLQQRIESFQV